MANKTASGLVSFVKDKLGTAYVYGAKGEVLTKAKYDMLKSMYGSSLVWQTDVLKVGQVCVDCSGLISWYTGTIRNSTAYKNTAAKVLTIDKIDRAVPGCAVWQQGHIGVYIGNGEIIEARGSAYGVVKTKVRERSFTHILWLKDIDYSTATSSSATSKTVDELAREVISGKWGNGSERRQRLSAAGYDYDAVQKRVNELLSGSSTSASYYPKCSYTGTSIVDALKSIKIDSSYAYRAKIAAANGIKNYIGTAQQNTQLLDLLRAGKLVRA